MSKETKTFHWRVGTDYFDGDDAPNPIRRLLGEDLINTNDYGAINVEPEIDGFDIFVSEVKPELWNYFEEERNAQGEFDHED